MPKKPQKIEKETPKQKRNGQKMPSRAVGPATLNDTVPLPPIAVPLLAWYRANRRALPFREDPTPYHVWVSEIMLQQTRMTAVLPYYTRFLAALAAAPEARLHKLWEGLGYYSRVRNMQRAAQQVVENWGGQLPADYAALLSLPGIGAYTAGAIASIAFGLPQVAVDGNVLRVFSRLLASSADITLPETKKFLSREVARQQPVDAPGDYNQALMELGALVCVPGVPACESCPLAALCRGRQAGIAHRLPQKPPKKEKPRVPVWLAVVHCGDAVLLQRRPGKGLLAGLWQPVLLEGVASAAEAESRLRALLPGVEIRGELPPAKHIFTHKVWQMNGWVCTLPPGSPLPAGAFVLADAAGLRENYALPSAFRAYLPFLYAMPKEENVDEPRTAQKATKTDG